MTTPFKTWIVMKIDGGSTYPIAGYTDQKRALEELERRSERRPGGFYVQELIMDNDEPRNFAVEVEFGKWEFEVTPTNKEVLNTFTYEGGKATIVLQAESPYAAANSARNILVNRINANWTFLPTWGEGN